MASVKLDVTVQNELASALREALPTGRCELVMSCPGGMINQNAVFDTDVGRVFAKVSYREMGREMFEGESASLEEIARTRTVKVPKPIKVINVGTGGCALVMEYLQLSPLVEPDHFKQLGESVAQLHLANEKCLHSNERSELRRQDEAYVGQFGFHRTTSNGFIVQDTRWTQDWMDYFRRKMKTQISLIETNYGDTELCELWRRLAPKLPQFFQGVDVRPSLLHGDLWDMNLGVLNGQVVVLDPGCFYGHSEFDLALPSLCTETPAWAHFFSAYHAIIPQAEGFVSRAKLYQLYHHINHWNHFPLDNMSAEREDRAMAVRMLQELLNL